MPGSIAMPFVILVIDWVAVGAAVAGVPVIGAEVPAVGVTESAAPIWVGAGSAVGPPCPVGLGVSVIGTNVFCESVGASVAGVKVGATVGVSTAGSVGGAFNAPNRLHPVSKTASEIAGIRESFFSIEGKPILKISMCHP